MASTSEREWEWAAGLFVGGLILWKLTENGVSVRSLFEPSLPKGARLPETGDLRQVPAVPTALDVRGFAELYNKAVQIASRPLASDVEDFLRAHDVVSLSWGVPDVDDEYDAPAAMFASQAAVETANGTSVYNYNTGNVTVAKGDYYLNPKVKAPLKFGSFNFPLQGAVAHVSRVKRLWPDAYRAAFSGTIDAYAHGLQDGALKYAGAAVSAQALASAIRDRAVQLGFAGQGLTSILAGGQRRLRRGMRGADVAEWQTVLRITPDGVFGPVTYAATRAFQRENGLVDDGIVGPKTWEVAGP